MASPSSWAPGMNRGGAGRMRHGSIRAEGWHAVVVGMCAFAAVALLLLARQHWFFADDWTFLTRAGPDDLDLLVQPLNGHWMGLTAVVFAAARSTVGLSSYLPFVGPAVLTHVVLGYVLWRWQRRDGVRGWVAAGLVGAFLAYGAGGENLLFAVNVGFNASLLFGLAYLLLIDGSTGEWTRARVVLALVVGLAAVPAATTGPMLVAAGAVWLAWRRDWPGLTATAVPPLAIYLVWLGVAEGGGGLAGGSAGDLAAFVGALAVTAAGRLLGAPTLAWSLAALGVVAGGLGVLRPRVRRAASPRGLTWLVAATGLAFAVATALARVQFGVGTWRSDRYAYVVAALLLPVVGAALDRLTRGPRPVRIAVAVLLPAAVALNAHALLDVHRDQVALERHLRSRWVAAAQLLDSGLDPIPVNVDRYWSPNLHVEHLRDLVAEGELTVPTEPVPDPWRLEARVELRSVLHGASPFPRLRVPELPGAGADGCVELAPGAAIPVRADGPTGLVFHFEEPTIARVHTTTSAGRSVAFPRVLSLRTPSPRVFWIDLGERATLTTTIDHGGRVCALATQDIGRFSGTAPG